RRRGVSGLLRRAPEEDLRKNQVEIRNVLLRRDEDHDEGFRHCPRVAEALSHVCGTSGGLGLPRARRRGSSGLREALRASGWGSGCPRRRRRTGPWVPPRGRRRTRRRRRRQRSGPRRWRPWSATCPAGDARSRRTRGDLLGVLWAAVGYVRSTRGTADSSSPKMIIRWAAEYLGWQVVRVMRRSVGLRFGWPGTGAVTSVALGFTILRSVTV